MYLLEILGDAFASEWSVLQEMHILEKIAVSAFCGALIGLEREHAEKPAGLRTNMLISVGATLFTLASIMSWKYTSGAAPTVDPGRIAAQIVSGIGFLGAGVILKTGMNIIGITTAATIWLVAAIGMMIGLGYPLLGFIVALASTGALFLLGKLELTTWFSPKNPEE
ncbi:MAG: MgtC/SapB family protein [Candidatus Altiarchaeales archaeon]|nr:MgtC/SapB family protein [Candidatus Altiarchaeales archaeon]